jgi:hypothetical protein
MEVKTYRQSYDTLELKRPRAFIARCQAGGAEISNIFG